MADVVAAGVLAVLHELDGVPKQRAFVHAGDEALDHLTCPQVEASDLGDGRGMQKPTGIIFLYRHSGRSLIRSRLASRERKRPEFSGRLRSPARRDSYYDAKIFLNRSSRVSSLSLAGVSSISFLMTVSEVMPSEAAVKLVRMRCRSTG